MKTSKCFVVLFIINRMGMFFVQDRLQCWCDTFEHWGSTHRISQILSECHIQSMADD